MSRIAIVGGGAAGMFAAGRALELGEEVVLFEKKDRTGLKVGITGKGRCNLTNNCDAETFIANLPRNPRFMYGAIRAFSPQDTMALFERLGVPLKTERGNRVFPVSDRALDIVAALRRYCSGAKLIRERVTGITVSDGAVTAVVTEKSKYSFDRVILCTGGKSYPLIGSEGDGYAIAEALGIGVVPPRASLVPLETEEKTCAEAQGLSLKNTAIRFFDTKKPGSSPVYEDFGEMLFTHFGVSGPMSLSASAHLGELERGRYRAEIDLKPALDEKQLDARLLSDFSKNINREFKNSLGDLLPKKLIPVIVSLSGIDPEKKVNVITREERRALVTLLKAFPFTVRGPRPIDEAIVTSGGISVKEIDPKTMGSKKIRGLYFAGELIDVDGYTGGFNLQIAFSTAFLAAKAAAAT